MKLLEYQGKELFKQYGINVPEGKLIGKNSPKPLLKTPLVLKSQVPVGDRKKEGGILFVKNSQAFLSKKRKLFNKKISGFLPEKLLVEESIPYTKEFYVSFSYDTGVRKPVISISEKGGSGIKKAKIFPINLSFGLPDFYIRDILFQSKIKPTSELKKVILSLWKIFEKEKALLVEVNPLFELKNGSFVAGDAKVILDNHVVNPKLQPYLDLPGNIAILASGGGASMINLDALMHYGGKPANYVEYSGNPPASVVEELTVRVLSRPNLIGCWTVGGTANFTDIYETMLGFVQGLRKIKPKPSYPIVVRRDGPRREEAFKMLKEVAKKERYNFHLFGPETEMSESAKILINLVRKDEHSS
ncbi:MAG: hypothetical protein KJI71_04700 [Patescibacteria group bacterium]|nr:hypothetical protein [Patescibacteria group bacterium]